MFKKQYLAVASALVLTAGLFPASSDAQVAKKNLAATYNNIKVLYNGNQVSTTIEPFIVNGTTYIPLRMMAGVFNKDITWDGTNYTINVKDQADPGYESQLAQKDAEISRLKAQIDDLNDEIDGLEDDLADYEDDDNSDDIDDVIDDLEDQLNDDYGDFEDLEWDISLSGDEDDIEVEISIDLSEYQDDFDDLSNSKLEKLVEDIVNDIWDESDLEDADIEGVIIDSDSDDEQYDFEGDASDGSIYFDGDEI
ncbi:stalk domain-containing protein [Brevibacillus choshinensis]|uniref:Copper amine oxidase N-terminal domain-containing protein n=1 Tax=Brevibacillus choshinensis TaxID=54911 RepID=A0ABX7FRH4_BRECH|nr:stalk domain-containing protein [Brevibacillus choshinensis]QRG68836.1 copper amine oxidase N-terminal domain-containing protein [Brevibacillus choshinensis]